MSKTTTTTNVETAVVETVTPAEQPVIVPENVGPKPYANSREAFRAASELRSLTDGHITTMCSSIGKCFQAWVKATKLDDQLKARDSAVQLASNLVDEMFNAAADCEVLMERLLATDGKGVSINLNGRDYSPENYVRDCVRGQASKDGKAMPYSKTKWLAS